MRRNLTQISRAATSVLVVLSVCASSWAQNAPRSAAGAAAGAPNADKVKSAKFTILLLTWDGPGHVRKSKEARDRLAKLTGMRDMYLVHSENLSTLYSGYYAAINFNENEAEAARAKTDMAKLVQFQLGEERPFSGALMVAIPTPDPEAPREWDLKNARGAYSLEIGAFKDRPDRKEAAVSAVKEARGLGLEAYFYHGPTTSSVLVGAFPSEALRTIRPDTRVDASKEILVVPFKPKDLPESGEFLQADGTTAKVVEFRVEVVDLQLKSLMRQFPEHAVNGSVAVRRISDPKTGQVLEKFAESFVVDITQVQRDSVLAAGPEGGSRQGIDTPSPDVVVPRPSTPGGGLKGIR